MNENTIEASMPDAKALIKKGDLIKIFIGELSIPKFIGIIKKIGPMPRPYNTDDLEISYWVFTERMSFKILPPHLSKKGNLDNVLVDSKDHYYLVKKDDNIKKIIITDSSPKKLTVEIDTNNLHGSLLRNSE